LRNDAEFAAAVEELQSAGVQKELGGAEECAERGVEAFTRLRNPAGYVHEIFYGATFSVGSFLPGKPMAASWRAGKASAMRRVLQKPSYRRVAPARYARRFCVSVFALIKNGRWIYE
jgi:hypothetical protein